MENIKKTEFAYMAGYIDGDGCFYIGKQKIKGRLTQKYVSSLTISSTNTLAFLDFHEIFGGSVRPVSKFHKTWKKTYHYTTKKERSLQIAHHILPYLVERREECELMVKFINSHDARTKEKYIKEMNLLKKAANLAELKHLGFNTAKCTIIPTEEDFSYLAGFIDAECNFGIHKYKPKDRPNYTYKIALTCVNSKYPTIEWAIKRFGGNIQFMSNKESSTRRRDMLQWQITGKALSKIIAKIHPYLKYKQPVCEELMKFYDTTLINGGARHTETFRSHYAKVLTIREEIVRNVHKLNSKGKNSINI